MAIFTVGFNPAIDRILECPDFHVGGHQMARQVALLAAGKAANVSRALALLNTDSIATGFVGTDELELFHNQLMAVGPGRVLCRFIEVTGATRENITILDPKRKLETHIRDRGFSVSPGEAKLLEEKLKHEVRSGDVVAFSGSLCGGISTDLFAALLDQCAATGAKLAVDTSGEALKAVAHKRLWLLKPNLEELGMIVGAEVPNAASAVRDATRPLTKNIQHLLVSRGAAGAVLVTASGAWSARVLNKEAAVRTVGCGDHLVAAFISELTAGRDVVQAFRMAMAVATVRAMTPTMEEFDIKQVDAAMAQVAVEEI
jgi:1-phosphofructokinase